MKTQPQFVYQMKNTKISVLTQLLVDTENTGGHPVLLGPEVRQNTGIALLITNVDKKDRNSKMPIAQLPFPTKVRCLKITEKVSSNIVREVCYIYILNGQKFIINTMVILASFWKPKACNKVWKDKNWWKCQNQKIKIRHFEWFHCYQKSLNSRSYKNLKSRRFLHLAKN